MALQISDTFFYCYILVTNNKNKIVKLIKKKLRKGHLKFVASIKNRSQGHKNEK